MDKAHLEKLSNWFEDYAKSYADEQGKLPIPSARKLLHTHEVRSASVRIAVAKCGANLSGSLALLAECGGLLHDVARFEQYKVFKTFYDGRSFDHGENGARIIREKKILADLPEREASLILKAVSLHNKPVLPPGLDSEELCIAKVVRDADKVAILSLIAEYVDSDSKDWRDPAITLEMPDNGSYTKSVALTALEGHMVLHKDMRCVNDFLLSLCAWPVDINYAESARMIIEARLFERIGSHLPDDALMKEVMASTESRLKKLAHLD